MTDLTSFFKLIITFLKSFIETCADKLTFSAFGFNVSLIYVIFGFIIFGFAINVFWKGAKS